MSDSDPFSGIPLSPPPPPAEINPDDLSDYQLFALALTDYDCIYQPAVRALANIVATKITSLTETEIARLSDDRIGSLVETELSRLSDDEKWRLLKAGISGFFDGAGDAVSSSLATEKLVPDFATVLAEITHSLLDVIEKNKHTPLMMFFKGFFYTEAVILVIVISIMIKEWIAPPRAKSSIIKDNVTNLKEKRQKLMKNSFLSRYSCTLSPDLKGLKGIGEIYNRGTDLNFR